jgi:hypothetical protein
MISPTITTIAKTTMGHFACEQCYDPNDPEQQEDQGRPNYKERKNTSDIGKSLAVLS